MNEIRDHMKQWQRSFLFSLYLDREDTADVELSYQHIQIDNALIISFIVSSALKDECLLLISHKTYDNLF